MASKRKQNQLNDRQLRFIEEYLDPRGAKLNATQAAINAGYSPKTAQEQSSRLLSNAIVSAEIEKRCARRRERSEITAERVIGELAKLSFANMQDYITVTEEGEAFVDLSELDRDRAAAIQEITVDHYTEGRGDEKKYVKKTKFRLSDKRAALELLGKHLGVFEPTDVRKKDRLEELMAAKHANYKNHEN